MSRVRPLAGRRASAFAMAWLVLALTVAGCTDKGSTATPPDSTSSQPDLGPIPSAAEMQDRVMFPLPLDAYQLAPAQQTIVDQAIDKADKACLRRFGFDPRWPAPVTPSGPEGQVGYLPRLYGIGVESEVDRYGYHPPPDDTDARKAAANTNMVATYPQVMFDIERGAIAGDYNGVAVPEKGCLGEAYRAVYGSDAKLGGQPGSQQTATDLGKANKFPLDAQARTEQDPRLVAAFGIWSRCMADQGYQYKTPWDANSDEQWWKTDTASAKEIQTAKTDLACRRKQNLVGLWYAVTTAYQNQVIEQNAAYLAEVKKQNDALVRTATEVLGR